jgi:hypothetical protein
MEIGEIFFIWRRYKARSLVLNLIIGRKVDFMCWGRIGREFFEDMLVLKWEFLRVEKWRTGSLLLKGDQRFMSKEFESFLHISESEASGFFLQFSTLLPISHWTGPYVERYGRFSWRYSSPYTFLIQICMWSVSARLRSLLALHIQNLYVDLYVEC